MPRQNSLLWPAFLEKAQLLGLPTEVDQMMQESRHMRGFRQGRARARERRRRLRSNHLCQPLVLG